MFLLMFQERNSATLLFSALVTRIFGVHRSREELSIRNRMTGRIFFLRYPSLYDFLLKELKEAVASMEACCSNLQPALFPVLLLLSRLYPSSLEGTDSNLQVQYISHINTSLSYHILCSAVYFLKEQT
jgi:hypothetical protein